MNTLIFVLFLVNGEAMMHSDFPPLPQPSIEVCEARKVQVTPIFEQIKEQTPAVKGYIVGCVSYSTKEERDEKVQEHIDLLLLQRGESL